MRIGLVAGGFFLLVLGVAMTPVGFEGWGSCSTSPGQLPLPFPLDLTIGCQGYELLVFLGVASLFIGSALILGGAVATEESDAPERIDSARRRNNAPPRHTIGLGPAAGWATASGAADTRPRPRTRAAPGASPAAPGGTAPPFEERACPSCGFSNLLASSVCARCGVALPEAP